MKTNKVPYPKFVQDKLSNEIEIVRELGDKIGYGHLMSLASALWREKLKETGMPTVGAFVSTCLPFIKEEHQQMTSESEKHYDQIVEAYGRKPI